jgi:serine/threonine-protein kinase HSL1 (negative regulator of Swe1 kinase)
MFNYRYLILEYVDRGELFEHIASKGRLDEEEAIKFFRQMMSAVGYCHAINICHRDLKPENILMTSEGNVKIADFGMAALHQGPGYKLRTSCGSPHYAAPELVKGVQYRGDKADIWSLGVILFAMLAGRLPFDVDTPQGESWIPALLNLIKRGKYEMEEDFSSGARNLIQKLLVVNPRDRISMEQLWKHPLVRKYDHLDDLKNESYLPPSLKDASRVVTRKRDIDTELLRHLRSMWHAMTEQQLIAALLSEA